MPVSDTVMPNPVELLRVERDVILSRWLAVARAQPFHQAEPDSVVTDHMPYILDALLTSLGVGSASAVNIRTAVLGHASTRVQQGLNSGDVVTEFRLLRVELQRVLSQSQAPITALLSAIAAVHDQLDVVVATVLRTFDELAQARAGGLAAMERVAREVSALRPLDETLALICDGARDLLKADHALLALPEADGRLVYRASSGIELLVDQTLRVEPGEGVSGRVFATGVPALTFTQPENSDVIQQLDPLEGARGVQSLLVAPLLRGASVVGTLGVGSVTPREWSSSDKTVLEALAVQAAVAVDNARLYDAIERRERLLDQVVRGAPALIAVVRGVEHRFDLVNPPFQALLPSMPMVGMRATDVFPAFQRPEWHDFLDRARSGGTVMIGDVPIEVPDEGGTSTEIRNVSYTLLPLAGGAGDDAGVLIVGYETTEIVAQQARIEALAQLAAGRAATLAAVIGAIPDGVYVCDADSQFVTANESGAALLGLSLAEAQRPLANHRLQLAARAPNGDPLSPGDLPLVRALRGEVATNSEVLVRREDTGEDRLLRLSLAPIRNAAGAITGAVCVAHDITVLRQVERQKDEFVSRASHELKTPLTGAKGLLQLVEMRMRRGVEPAALQSLVESAARQVDRMTVLVDDLRDVSQLRGGRLRLRMSRIDLLPLLQQSIEALQATTETHTIQLDCNARSLFVRGDATRILQMIDNLVSNAIKYSPNGGEILVRCATEAGQVVVEIKDPGIGVPDADRAALFEPFHRAVNANDASTGMGLGLYISREIARQHGGDLVLASTDQHGSMFRLSLPFASEQPSSDDSGLDESA